MGRNLAGVCKRGHRLEGNNLVPHLLKKGYKACRACNGDSTYQKRHPEADLQEWSDSRYLRLVNGWSCKYCHRLINPEVSLQIRFCGFTCRSAWQKLEYQKSKEEKRVDTEKQWANAALRRAERLGVDTVSVSRMEVADRDGWKCYLCDKAIPKGAEETDPECLHIEHLIPLSMGGSHELENCAASHARCNLKKGASVGDRAYKKLTENILFYATKGAA